eukprot:7670970-Heterocapsa_arctica.AAC.1
MSPCRTPLPPGGLSPRLAGRGASTAYPDMTHHLTCDFCGHTMTSTTAGRVGPYGIPLTPSSL